MNDCQTYATSAATLHMMIVTVNSGKKAREAYQLNPISMVLGYVSRHLHHQEETWSKSLVFTPGNSQNHNQ